jgi:hypothetical protein
VIYDDPYFYPSYRYGGAVVVRPPLRHQPRFVFKERADGEPGTPLLATRGGSGSDLSGPPRVDAGGPSRVPTTLQDGRASEGARGERTDRGEGAVVVPWPGRTTPPATRGARGEGGDRSRPTASPTPTSRPDGTAGTVRRRPVLERRGSGETQRPSSRLNPETARPPASTRPGPPTTTPSRSPNGKAPSVRPTSGTRPGPPGATPARSSKGKGRPILPPGGASVRPTRPPGGGAMPSAASPGRGVVRSPARPSGGSAVRTPSRPSGVGTVGAPSRPPSGAVRPSSRPGGTTPSPSGRRRSNGLE